MAERTKPGAGLRALFATKGGLLMHCAFSFCSLEGTAKDSFPVHPGHTLFLQVVRGKAACAVSLGPGCLLFAFFFFGCDMWHVGFLVPQPGIEPVPLYWKHQGRPRLPAFEPP